MNYVILVIHSLAFASISTFLLLVVVAIAYGKGYQRGYEAGQSGVDSELYKAIQGKG